MLAEFDHEFPPGDWTVDELARTFDAVPTDLALPRYDDPWWEQARARHETARESIRQAAETARKEPFDVVRATDYFDGTTGKETRRTRLALFALAECFERNGEYEDLVLDYVWEICREANWAAQTLDRRETGDLPRPAAVEERLIDLQAADAAQLLAEVEYVLGDELHPAIGERVRAEVKRRVFEPFLARDDIHWIDPPMNNWTPVCVNGVLSPALALVDDPEYLARITDRCLESLEYYLETLDHDGASEEGVGYWNLAMRNYVQAARNLEARTESAYSLFSPPIVGETARFPIRAELSPGRYPAFSDGSETNQLSPHVGWALGTRCDVAALIVRGQETFDEASIADGNVSFSNALRDLYWAGDVSAEHDRGVPPERDFFDGHDWWFARDDPTDPDGLSVAVKGGDNNESHNHNDLGTFVFHYKRESLLTDLGSESYHDEYFSPKRYGDVATRSLGHSVPYVNSCEQVVGEIAEHLDFPNEPREPDHERAAVVVERENGTDIDRITYELGDAYPAEAGIRSLTREFMFHRGTPGHLAIEDVGAFYADSDNTLTSIFVSYRQMESDGDDVIVLGNRSKARISVDRSEGLTTSVEHLPNAVNRSDVYRARFKRGADSDVVRNQIAITVDNA